MVAASHCECGAAGVELILSPPSTDVRELETRGSWSHVGEGHASLVIHMPRRCWPLLSMKLAEPRSFINKSVGSNQRHFILPLLFP